MVIFRGTKKYLIMKKIYFISGVLLAMASMSCNKDNGVVDTPSGTVLKAVIGTDDTKAAHTHYKDVVWSSGDALAVYNGSDFTRFNLTDGDGTTSGTFTASSDVTPTGFAVYPFAEVKSYDGSKNVTLTLPAEYTWAEQSLNAPMLALVSGSDLATFKQLCGYFKIDVDNLPATASKLVFFTDEQVITGDFNADVTDEYPGIYTWNVSNEWDRARRTVTVNFTAGEKASRTFYIPVPGGNYTKFKVSIQNAGGEDLITPKTWTASGDPATPVTIDKGTMKVLPAISCTPDTTKESTIWTGSITLSEDPFVSIGDLTYRGDRIWDAVEAGTVMKIYYTGSGDSNVVLNYIDGGGSWYDLDGTYYDWNSAGGEYVYNYTLSSDGVAHLRTLNEYNQNYGLVIKGRNATVTRIDLVERLNKPETVVWTGSFALGNWENNLQDLVSSFWTKVADGKVVTIYFNAAPASSGIMIQDGDWHDISGLSGSPLAGQTAISFRLNSTMLTTLQTKGGIVKGANLTITKITLR